MRSLTPDSPPPPGAMWMASVSRVSLEPCGQFQAAWPKWVREVPKGAGLAWVIPSINGRAWHPSKKNNGVWHRMVLVQIPVLLFKLRLVSEPPNGSFASLRDLQEQSMQGLAQLWAYLVFTCCYVLLQHTPSLSQEAGLK